MGQTQSASLIDTIDSDVHLDQYSVQDNGGVLVFGETLLATGSSALVVENETIVQVATYCAHSALVCESGRVYTAGDNYVGQLGLNCVGFPVALPNLVAGLEDHHVIAAACGDCFTLFLTATGEVYSCGTNKDGQLGLGYHKDQCRPTKVVDIPAVRQISAGYSHCAAITVTGQLFMWGSNSHGQLGVPSDAENKRMSPTMLTTEETVVGVACSYLQTAFITASGAAYKCGRRRSGVMGVMGEQEEVAEAPELIDIKARVVQVACGEEHSLALTDTGDVYAWGDNWYGQIGPKETSSRLSPARLPAIPGHTVVQIAAECSHSALLTADGSLYTLGLDDNGQLCHSDRGNRDVPTHVEQIAHLVVQEVVCGTSHTMVLVKQRKMINSMSEPGARVPAYTPANRETVGKTQPNASNEKQEEKREDKDDQEWLNTREASLKKIEEMLNERKKVLKKKEKMLKEKEQRLTQWEVRLTKVEESLRDRISVRRDIILETDC